MIPRAQSLPVPTVRARRRLLEKFLLKDTRVIHFVNADLIASGLSPLRPEMAALAAGRIFLRELDRLGKFPCGLRVREHVKRARLFASVKALESHWLPD